MSFAAKTTKQSKTPLQLKFHLPLLLRKDFFVLLKISFQVECYQIFCHKKLIGVNGQVHNSAGLRHMGQNLLFKHTKIYFRKNRKSAKYAYFFSSLKRYWVMTIFLNFDQLKNMLPSSVKFSKDFPVSDFLIETLGVLVDSCRFPML